MATEKASSPLERLIERWAPRAAEPASPARDAADAAALVEDLEKAIRSVFDPDADPGGPTEAAIKRAFDPERTKLALLLAIVEDARRMSTGSRDKMAVRLDDLEDLLDGLFVAIEALKSAPGGAARG